jgi:hypothetical protein
MMKPEVTRLPLRLRFAMPLAWLGAVLALAGCSSGTVEIKGDTGGANLGKIGIAYARATDRLGRPPRNPDELKRALQTEFGEADTYLVSPNDGQAYQIIWGVDIYRAEPEGAVVVAYEKRGVKGKRYVLTVGIAVRAMNDDAFAKAHFPNGHVPSRE